MSFTHYTPDTEPESSTNELTNKNTPIPHQSIIQSKTNDSNLMSTCVSIDRTVKNLKLVHRGDSVDLTTAEESSERAVHGGRGKNQFTALNDESQL